MVLHYSRSPPASSLPEAGGWYGLTRRAAELLDQQAANGQRLVADHLGGEPEARPAGEQPVLRVLLAAAPA